MPQTMNHEMTYDELYQDLTRRSKLAGITLTSAPPVSVSYLIFTISLIVSLNQ